MAYAYPAAPVGSLFLVSLRMTYLNQRLLNTYVYRLDTNPGTASVKTVADNMDALFGGANHLYPSHNALRDTNCLLAEVRIQCISPTRYVPIVYVKNTGGDATTAPAGLDTPNVAATISRRGVVASRRGVGSVHIPVPLSTDVFIDGQWTAGYQTKLTTHANAMMLDLALASGGTMKAVLFNRGANPDYMYIGTAFYQSNVRVMRRRTVGVGE